MARRKGEINKSEEIRQLYKAHPEMKAKEVVAALAEKGIDVTEGLVYFIKGKISGRKRRKKKGQKLVAKVAQTTVGVDALATIMKVKSLANTVGGMKKLKALIDALTE